MRGERATSPRWRGGPAWLRCNPKLLTSATQRNATTYGAKRQTKLMLDSCARSSTFYLDGLSVCLGGLSVCLGGLSVCLDDLSV